jgi:CRP/FNR family transcriptional regulator
MRKDQEDGPLVAAIPLWVSSSGKMQQLLSDRQRAKLAAIAKVVAFRRNQPIYHQGDRATFLFNLIEGVAKTANMTMVDGSEQIVGFHFPGDLIGLAEEGHYVNSAVAVTPARAIRFATASLDALLKNDPSLDLHAITKLCHELRIAQRHAIILAQRNAATKLKLFLRMIDECETANGNAGGELFLPMTRADIANYLGLSPETVSRAFAKLRKSGTIALSKSRHVAIVNKAKFRALLKDES